MLLKLTVNICFRLNVSSSGYCDVSGIDQCFGFDTHIDFDSQGFEGIFSILVNICPRKSCNSFCHIVFKKFLRTFFP